MRLFGKNPVIERIKSRPETVKKVYLQNNIDLSDIVRELKKAGLKFEPADKSVLQSKYGPIHSQGVIAEVDEYEYTPFTDIISDCVEKISIPVFLDGVTDPQNLGAVIRTLACMGGFSLIIPEHNACLVNETVLRVASGGENYIKIAKVINNVKAVKTIKERGVWIAGAVAVNGRDITKTDFLFPMAVIIGSEGKGIRPGLTRCLDTGLSIPMRGAGLSYNVSTAVSLICYEIARRESTGRAL
ncbi:MAG: RNA methyltransferase [Candidatus Omnitrophota bacterium]